MDIFTNVEFIILLTLGFGVIAYLVGRYNKTAGAFATIIGTAITFLAVAYYGLNGELDFTADLFPAFSYGFSNLGIFFAVIVSFIFLMVSFFNPYFVGKYKYPALYSMLFMFSLAGAMGVFFTNDFLDMFFFFEFVVWTSLFLIPLGGSKKAATMYYGFSAAGSFALLFAIFMIQKETGSFNMETAFAHVFTTKQSVVIFFLFMFSGFAKLGAFPLHIWLPKVLGKAPDPISAVFSGGLEKLGAFVAIIGIIRFMPMAITDTAGLFAYLNATAFLSNGMTLLQLIIGLLGAMTIVFGTLMAIRQDDAKKLLAYSSMSNGGYILVAIVLMDSITFSGGLYHIVAHALASTAAFLAIGAVSRQTGTTKMSELGGHIHEMPITYMVYLIAIISMAGIPPMGGFISKWLIFQGVIDKGLIVIGAATFFGSIGSFLYVFRPLAALFLGQQLPQFKDKVKEAPILMLIPLLVLSALNIVTGIFPIQSMRFLNINAVLNELGLQSLVFNGWTIAGHNGGLQATLIAGMFGIGVVIAFVLFMLLKKSKQVGLMDTYTAGNFIYTEELLHYSVDFYAPLERLYEKYINIMKNFYKSLANKVKEFGRVTKYFFFTNKPEITVFWIIVVIAFLLWGDIV